MNVNVVFVGVDFEGTDAVFERMNGLLAPFFKADGGRPLQLRCLYVGEAQLLVGGNASGKLCVADGSESPQAVGLEQTQAAGPEQTQATGQESPPAAGQQLGKMAAALYNWMGQVPGAEDSGHADISMTLDLADADISMALDWAETGRYMFPGALCEGLCAYMDRYPADVTVFAPTAAGRQLGCMMAAARGYVCYTEVQKIHELFPVLKVGRKVYSAHADGIFAGVNGKTVIVGSAAGERIQMSRKSIQWADERIQVVRESIQLPGGSVQLARELHGSPATVRDARSINLYDVSSLWKNFSAIASPVAPAGSPAGPAAPQLLSVRPKPPTGSLAEAKLVFIGGKGLKTKENYRRLEALAQKYGAACGCTRPAALGGFTDYSKVVGISGCSLKAELCLTFGVSGAAPFLYGVEAVRHLVAINKDAQAPIFSNADKGIVGDCMKIIEAMEGFEWHI